MKPRKTLRLLSNRIRPSTLALIGAATVSTALAANVTMNLNDAAGTSSFNTALHWDSGAAPTAGNNYFTAGFTLRTPSVAGTLAFAGDSLSLDTGGRLLGKPSAALTLDFSASGGLILNGGAIHMANGTADTLVLTIIGNISVNAASSLGALGFNANNTANFETLDMAGVITGSFPLTVAGNAANLNSGDNTGVVRLSAANPYSGTMTVAQPKSVSSQTNRLLQLNNINALQNATLDITATAPSPLSFTPAANTAPFKLGGLSGSSTQKLADTANNPVTLDIGGNGADTTYSGLLSGTGAIVKSGTGTLTFSNLNFYTGNTTVNGGTLALNFANLADSSTVTIATGAKVHLPHGTVDRVAVLVLNGVSQPLGVYNSSTPGGFITGTGSIEVYSGPPGPQNIILTASDAPAATVTTSLNGDIGNWSIPGVPAAGNNYYTGAFTIRTPATQVNQDLTFAGTSLNLNTGGRLLGKASMGNTGNTSVQTLTVNLVLNGGNIDQAAGGGNSKGTMVLQGSVNVLQPAFIGAFGDNLSTETLDFVAPVSGSGDITVAGAGNTGVNKGTVRLSAANPYTGVMSVIQPTGGNMSDVTKRLLQLNHPDALKFATLSLLATQPGPLSFTPASNTGPYNVGGLTGNSEQSLTDTAAAPVTLSIGANGADTFYDGLLTGSGNIIKVGAGTLTLTALNTYTGNTTVTGGTLAIEQAVLSDTGTVSIASGAALNLISFETDIVGGLILNGVVKGPGIYDSTNSGGLIIGVGKLQVPGAPASSFSTFMDTFPGLTAGDKLAGADPDKDGITNLVEYALSGLNPTMSNSLAGSLSGGTLSFTKRAEAVTNNDITYIIETSTNLGAAPGDWTTAAPVVNDPTTASYVLPTGMGKVFARLRIVKN